MAFPVSVVIAAVAALAASNYSSHYQTDSSYSEHSSNSAEMRRTQRNLDCCWLQLGSTIVGPVRPFERYC